MALKRLPEPARLVEPVIPQIVAKCPAMVKTLQRVLAIAGTPNTSVVLLGETGTGKDVFAQLIHRLSSRASQPYVAVDCGAIPSTLLESELFGHERGAFSGAVHKRHGKFELADGGTLLLDEISELPKSLQPALLRVLQSREVWPIGASRPRSFDVRIITATNADLAGMVRAGEFREDLYYRFSVFPIRLPPLRERTDDIAPLAELFVRECCRRIGTRVTRLSAEALQRLHEYSFPGNVRELKNIIEAAVILTSEGEIPPQNIILHPPKELSQLKAPVEDRLASVFAPLEPPADDFADSTGEFIRVRWGPNALNDLERDIIERALQVAGGNRTHAAKLLGLTRQSLLRRLKRFGFEHLAPTEEANS